MDKKDYLKIKEQVEIPLSLFYEYYLDKNKNNEVMDLKEFEAYFPQFMQYQAIETKNGVKFVNFTSIVKKVYDYFNQKWDL